MISTVNASYQHHGHGSSSSSDIFDWTCCCLADVHPKIRRSFPTLFGGAMLLVIGVVVSVTSPGITKSTENIGVQATSGFILIGFGVFFLLIGVVSFCHGYKTKHHAEGPRSYTDVVVPKQNLAKVTPAKQVSSALPRPSPAPLDPALAAEREETTHTIIAPDFDVASSSKTDAGVT